MTINKLEGDNEQALTVGDEGDKLTLFTMDMSVSRSFIFESVRFFGKLKSQVKGGESLRINELEN